MACAHGGSERSGFHLFGCLECGVTCCPQCAVGLESATYCRACARRLLGVSAVQAGAGFELH